MAKAKMKAKAPSMAKPKGKGGEARGKPKAKARPAAKATPRGARASSRAKAAARPKTPARASKPRAVPEGYHTVSPYLVVRSSVEALAFYERALGAKPGFRMAGPDGQSTVHAEMRVGDSTVMLTDENPQWGARSPLTLGGCPVSLHLYVEDADEVFDRAVAAGCTALMPIMDAFWGDRYGKVKDPFGHEWGIATHQEDLSEAEIEGRQVEWFASMSGAPSSSGS